MGGLLYIGLHVLEGKSLLFSFDFSLFENEKMSKINGLLWFMRLS